MGDSLYDIVKMVFDEVNKTPGGQGLLKMFDLTIFLEPSDGEPLYVETKRGTVNIKKGAVPADRDRRYVEKIVGREKDFCELFERKTRFIDAIWEGKIQLFSLHPPRWAWLTNLIKTGNKAPEYF